MWIDSHSHLYMDAFDEDLSEVLKRSWDAGIEEIIIPAENLEISRRVLEFCKQDQRLHPAVGLHPHDAETFDENTIDELRKLLVLDEVVALGEIGLDYFRMLTPQNTQEKCFAALLELAMEVDKPVIIHNRDSNEDMLSYLTPASKKGLKGVIHCFSGDADFARKCLALGFYISFAGQVTYPKAQELRDAAAVVPMDRIMVETDAPFLSPQKKRGKRNEPAHMLFTAEKIAEVKGVAIDELAKATRDNTKKIFSLD